MLKFLTKQNQAQEIELKAQGYAYSSLNPDNLTFNEHKELKVLQEIVEKYLVLHPKYEEYLDGLNEAVEGGLADKRPNLYAFYKRGQLTSLLQKFSKMNVTFDFISCLH